jgi:charged multivesicular body protein 4
MEYYVPLLLTIGTSTTATNTLTVLKYGAKYIGKGAYQVFNYLQPRGIEAQITDFDDRNDEVTLQEGAKSAIAKIQKSIELIEKKEQYLDTKIKNALREAFEKNKYGNKKGAIFALRRKKMYSIEYERLEGIHNGLIMKTMHLETMLINLEIYSTLKLAANQMKTINNGMSVDSVDDALDEIHESINITDEISSILTQPITTEVFDEDELLEELESIDEDVLNATIHEQLTIDSDAQWKDARTHETPDLKPRAGSIALNDIPELDLFGDEELDVPFTSDTEDEKDYKDDDFPEPPYDIEGPPQPANKKIAIAVK